MSEATVRPQIRKSSPSEIRQKYVAKIRHTTVRPESLSEDTFAINGLIKRQDDDIIARVKSRSSPKDSSRVIAASNPQEATVPSFKCQKCEWRLAGWKCTSTGCNKHLVSSNNTESILKCPNGHGTLESIVCCSKPMKKDGKVVVDLSKHEGKTRFQGEPALKCKSCGFEVDGYCCVTEPKCYPGGTQLHLRGFYERVWCAYVWKCPTDCATIGQADGGCIGTKAFQVICNCQGNDKEMFWSSFIEKYGHPYN